MAATQGRQDVLFVDHWGTEEVLEDASVHFGTSDLGRGGAGGSGRCLAAAAGSPVNLLLLEPSQQFFSFKSARALPGKNCRFWASLDSQA